MSVTIREPLTYSYATLSFLVQAIISCQTHEKDSRRSALEHRVSIALRGIIHVGVVEQFLDTEQHLQARQQMRMYARTSADLFDCNCRFPRLLFVENGQANSARWVYVGVE